MTLEEYEQESQRAHDSGQAVPFHEFLRMVAVGFEIFDEQCAMHGSRDISELPRNVQKHWGILLRQIEEFCNVVHGHRQEPHMKVLH